MESNSKQARLKQSVFEIADLFVEKLVDTNTCHFCAKQVTANDLENTKQAFRLDGTKLAHASCMKCDICQRQQRDPKNLHFYDEQLICGTCYYSLSCVKCTKPVRKDQRKTVTNKQGFQTWHLACFSCSECKKVISDDKYKIQKNIVKCLGCNPEAENLEAADPADNFHEFRKTISEETVTFLQLYDEFLASPAVGQMLIRNFLYASKSQFSSDILSPEEIHHLIYLDSLAFLPLFREMVRSAHVRIHKSMKESYLEFVKQLRVKIGRLDLDNASPAIPESTSAPEILNKSPRIRRDVPGGKKGMANVMEFLKQSEEAAQANAAKGEASSNAKATSAGKDSSNSEAAQKSPRPKDHKRKVTKEEGGEAEKEQMSPRGQRVTGISAAKKYPSMPTKASAVSKVGGSTGSDSAGESSPATQTVDRLHSARKHALDDAPHEQTSPRGIKTNPPAKSRSMVEQEDATSSPELSSSPPTQIANASSRPIRTNPTSRGKYPTPTSAQFRNEINRSDTSEGSPLTAERTPSGRPTNPSTATRERKYATPTKQAITLDLEKEELASALHHQQQQQQQHQQISGSGLPDLPTIPPIPLTQRQLSTGGEEDSATSDANSNEVVPRKATYKRVTAREDSSPLSAVSSKASSGSQSSSPPLRLSPRDGSDAKPSIRNILLRDDSMSSTNVPYDSNQSLNPEDWVCDYCEDPIGSDVNFEVAKGNTRIHSFCFVCVICEASLHNVKPYVWVKEEKALMCGPCAKNIIKHRCSGCKKLIILKYISLESQQYAFID